MPRLNIDEQTQLAEPIEITLDGKEYTISKITVDLMDRVTSLQKEKDGDLNVPIKQLALLIGASEKDLKGIDIRKIGRALEFITNSIKAGMDTKNP